MPLNPTAWSANAPLTAKALNTALYEYQPGNRTTPTGILFHTTRPTLAEGSLSMSISQASSGSGAYTNMLNNNGWHNYYDSAAFFDGGMDQAGANANGGPESRVAGSAGASGSVGGWWLMVGNPRWTTTTGNGASGASFYQNGTIFDGGKQLSSTVYHNGPYAVDVINLSNTVQTSIYGWCVDGSSNSYAYDFNATDYSGRICRLYSMWLSVSQNGTTATSLPVPFSGYTASTAITSSFLNGSAGINGPLSFLNNPPLLRVVNAPGGTIPASTPTVVTLSSSPTVDNYSGFNTSSYTYTVPISGVYLVHGLVSYYSSTSGNVEAGLNVNNSTLHLWGPSAGSSGGTNIAPSITRLLDLNAGDTLQLLTYTGTSGNSLSTTFRSKLVVAWLGSLGVPSTLWTVPNTSFRWQAGTPGSQLPSLWQSHVANDISFLMQRPYLMTWQSTQQTGLANNGWVTITMNTVGGRVHGSNGDSYSGWTSGASNKYTAQRAGWYLVVAGYQQNASTGTYSCIAAVNQSPGGSSEPDYFQQQQCGASSSIPAGAEAVGMYYLRVGDTIQPQYQQSGGASTFSTASSSGNPGQECHFSCIWISQ